MNKFDAQKKQVDKSPSKIDVGGSAGEEDDSDELADLAPISISRSKSVAVTSEPKKIEQPVRMGGVCDYDQQYQILFYICVWVCRNEHGFFSQEYRTVC